MSWCETDAWLKSKDRELKRQAEQDIMGERHEGFCVAAGEPEKSVWTGACIVPAQDMAQALRVQVRGAEGGQMFS